MAPHNLRYGLSYRDVEELLAERGVTVDHVTVYRWVQRFTPEFIEAARFCRHTPGDRWFADETYIKVAGQWTYLYRAVDQHGQVIDVMLSQRRDLAAARRFFNRALRTGTIPAEVTPDRAPAYPRVLDELIPSALHTIERYANNPVETDHGRLKARLRPMRGLKRRRCPRPPPAPRSLRPAHDGYLTSRSSPSARSIMRTNPPMQHCPAVCLADAHCRIRPYLIKAAPAAPPARPPRQALPWGARPAQAGPHPQSTQIKAARTFRHPVQTQPSSPPAIVQLAATASRAAPPGRRMRWLRHP